MEVRKLKNHPYANCYVSLLEDGTIIFTSYNTDVLVLAPSYASLKEHTGTEIGEIIDRHREGEKNQFIGTWVACTGLYSMTTRHQIGYFLKEYAPLISYQDIKMIVESNGDDCIAVLYSAGQPNR